MARSWRIAAACCVALVLLAGAAEAKKKKSTLEEVTHNARASSQHTARQTACLETPL
jgi:hypothetical protein